MTKTRYLRPLTRLLAWAPAASWAYLLAGRGQFWSARRALPPAGEPAEWPRATVVVPARDEAAVLPRTLPSLLAQDYPGEASVVLVDDRSSDGTAAVARALAAGRPRLALTVVEGAPPPRGWAGKPWALAQGAERAMRVAEPPEWLLFTDADIAHPPYSLRQLVAAALASGKAAISLMARLSAESRWERLAMPAFVYFFAQIYPFSWVNDPHRRTAAAAGGCLLVRADALAGAGGLQRVANATIDDVALAKALKGAGYDIWLGLAGTGAAGEAPEVRSLRSYPRLADVWEMVARNAYTELGHSPAALVGALTGLSCVYLAPPLLAIGGAVRTNRSVAAAGALAWAAMAASYLPTLRYYRVHPAGAPALPVTCALYMAMTLDSARRHRAGTKTWKGRPA